jgi:hypothetical protein
VFEVCRAVSSTQEEDASVQVSPLHLVRRAGSQALEPVQEVLGIAEEVIDPRWCSG